MNKKLIYGWLLILLSSLYACQEDKLGEVALYDLNRFEFPQGNNPWDQEIKQIADDWGMYVIYKHVDSTHLNRRWTIPDYRGPIYVCDEPSDTQIQEYLSIIKNGLLATLDKNKEADRQQLPVYFYLVNNFHDNNPDSPTYGKYVKVKQDGFDYWSLSFTDEEWEAGLSGKITHKITCTLGYPSIKSALASGDIKIPEEFLALSDYETRIGTRYYSLEQYKADNPTTPPFMIDILYENTVFTYEKDPANAYQRRGFLPQTTEDFELTNASFHNAPKWMPWIKLVLPGIPPVDQNSDYLPTTEARQEQDFLNYIRYAMMYTPEDMLLKYPTEQVTDDDELKGNQIITKKYNIIISYIKSTLGLDLPKYADLLKQ